MLGIFLGGIFITITTKTYYARKLRSGTVRPENRLPFMKPMAVLFPAALFWFGWTSNPSVPWPARGPHWRRHPCHLAAGAELSD